MPFTATGKQNKENDMKKKLVALALITGLTMTTVASADWGKGGRGYGGYGDCPQMQGQITSNWIKLQRIKLNNFL